jgi:hypothetical protein
MKKINIEKYKAEEGDVKEYQEFFVELDAKEIQTLANVLKSAKTEKFYHYRTAVGVEDKYGESKIINKDVALSEFTELENLYKKLSDFDNHTNQEDCRLELYTG